MKHGSKRTLIVHFFFKETGLVHGPDIDNLNHEYNSVVIRVVSIFFILF